MSHVKIPPSSTNPPSRRDASNNVDIEKACRDYKGTWTKSSRGVVVTWSETVDIFGAIVGKFNPIGGKFLVHSFDGDCNHVASADLEPQSPGFKTEVDVGDGSVTVKVKCFDAACSGNKETIGDMEVSGGKSAMADCDGDVHWVEGIGRYAHKMCGFLNG